MKTSIVQFVHAVVVLMLGIGLEEVLPRVYGVGFPVLLATVLFLSSRRHFAALALIALAAGAVEDAVSSLPMMLSASFFLAVAVMARKIGFPRGLVLLSYPLYQVWLEAWTSSCGSAVFGRILVSLPIGALTALAVTAVMAVIERRAAVDEEG